MPTKKKAQAKTKATTTKANTRPVVAKGSADSKVPVTKKPVAKGSAAVKEAAEKVKTAETFPIVGIGASAGGLAAFEAFFSGMPADTDPGMAFILVQHLAPDHKSILTELIRRYTRMEVFEVEDGMTVHPNCTYIIPPNNDMAFFKGTLQLLPPSSPRGQRLPIDFFFRSLAQDQHERAIGIVLSGTGSDGTLGLRAIKSEGGMIMAQSPSSAEFNGMPDNALATGLVDYELIPAKMPAQLIAYANNAFIRPSPGNTAKSAPKNENAMQKIFVVLRSQTGHDFSQYKTTTIHRRIDRRMAVQQIETIDNYVNYLQRSPDEVEALFYDMLIGVTNFFRDSEAFEFLEKKIIPKLFAGKPENAVIRVWSPGCSTGEEAYSIAILLMEHMDKLKQRNTVQLFATDIDSRAIAKAREGIYPAGIAADISPERLAKFFTAEPDGRAYRINKNIRDLLVFSEHNMIKDPPFSKLDLLSCRNLLIYMGSEIQKQLIPLFHYALKPGGFLFMGTSETVGDFDDLFNVLDRKFKLYQRKEILYSAPHIGAGQFLPSISDITKKQLNTTGKQLVSRKQPLRELTEEALLKHFEPSAVLVNNQGIILYQNGHTGMFLEPAPGEAATSNVFKMAREGLKEALTSAMHQAVSQNKTGHYKNLRVKTNGHFTTVNLTVKPTTAGSVDSSSSLYLIILEEMPDVPLSPAEPVDTSIPVDARIDALQQDLKVQKEYLKNTNEALKTSTEELRSSSEEMQSVNEELQSTNEELETSKEELQSINEELATVNTELQTKVIDLTRANNDMNNLLAGTGIATLFVDLKLRILRFTPSASAIINLIQSDIGRPVAHIASNLLNYNQLVADVKMVLENLVPKEITVSTPDGKVFTMRILPYRTLDNVIEGAVISFVDITTMVQMQNTIKANELLVRLATAVRDSRDAIIVRSMDGTIIAWNPGAVRIYGWTEVEALKMNIRHMIPAELREEALAITHQLSLSKILKPYSTRRIANDGSVLQIRMVATALINETGQVYAIATTERKIKAIPPLKIEKANEN
ncbi:MAG: PAS domain-containing protein [Candidatus Riflebacteria bacterium]|nr:PAS domain-containing protein [Candidatus Riflebacteria bacterium]